MKAISRKSLTDAAMQSLRTEIMSGRWAVGDQLPNEAALSAKLGVSRGTVREAVRALVAQGMLETRQGSGTYVRSTSDASRSLDRIRHSSLRDRFETRALLETEAARLAALRATPETIAQLEKMLAQRSNRDQLDRSVFVARDFAFHEAIVAASGNSALIEVYNLFSASIRDSIEATLDGELPEPSDEAHRQIVEAIAAGDPDEASATVRRFMAPLIEALERLLAS
ncbi:DNA-binding FadR family transcriptional regulator [Ochrobactrum daejeonense]|uniref:DNA-binding FadR family transcriptional regulator n=1 Tax=Brucella daejeonensis TaxID=659015 RepID=A0A7W9B004_9HYPH|nr:FadR/GntR family transcriptional regulator [Brucella daejeonensis]MBB5703743.1 DNA-binding FadR family transcriptional regulator [Brucella daejeonensis]